MIDGPHPPESTPTSYHTSRGRNTDKCICNHTLHLLDAQGKRHGSWADQYIGGRWRVVCRCCGRFYGFHPAGYERVPQDLEISTP